MANKPYNLEDRLISFACICLEICDDLPPSRAGQNLEFQLAKSATAAALIYGEAQAAESPQDFVHRMKMVLKEIRETRVNLRIIQQKPLITGEKIGIALSESGELMAIFLKSVETAKNNAHVLVKKRNLR